jgi:hypothetical protein
LTAQITKYVSEQKKIFETEVIETKNQTLMSNTLFLSLMVYEVMKVILCYLQISVKPGSLHSAKLTNLFASTEGYLTSSPQTK